MKLADKPGSVGLIAKADSHSSRRTITCTLKQPTRWQREPRQYQPIWSCCRWRLPRFTVTKYARLCGPIPRLIPSYLGFQRTAVSRHPALCSPDFPPSLEGDRKGLPQIIMAINCQIKCDGDCLASFKCILPRHIIILSETKHLDVYTLVIT
ncbi:hypothetical protein MCEKH45_00495 [Methylophilaceae bacterium]